MTDDERITVGDFMNPTSADRVFSSMEDAIVAAQAEARGHGQKKPIAVWIGAELHRVYLRGYELSPLY